jgi:hypothetical protein
LALAGVATAEGDNPLTKQQFIKKADKICRAAETQGDQAAEQYFAALGPNEEPDIATLTAFIGAYGPVVQGEIDDIRALDEPKADRKKVKKILGAVQDALDTITEDPSVLLDSSPFAKADKLAQAYGLKVCGADSGE